MYLSKNITIKEWCHSDKLVEYNKTHAIKRTNNMDSKQLANAQRACEFVFQPIRDYYVLFEKIESGFRNPFVNKLVGGEKKSKHQDGGTADINILGISAKQVFNDITSGKIKYKGIPVINYIDKIIYEAKDNMIWLHIQVTDKPRKIKLQYKNGAYHEVKGLLK